MENKHRSSTTIKKEIENTELQSPNKVELPTNWDSDTVKLTWKYYRNFEFIISENESDCNYSRQNSNLSNKKELQIDTMKSYLGEMWILWIVNKNSLDFENRVQYRFWRYLRVIVVSIQSKAVLQPELVVSIAISSTENEENSKSRYSKSCI